jgi:hypothetical protein
MAMNGPSGRLGAFAGTGATLAVGCGVGAVVLPTGLAPVNATAKTSAAEPPSFAIVFCVRNVHIILVTPLRSFCGSCFDGSPPNRHSLLVAMLLGHKAPL